VTSPASTIARARARLGRTPWATVEAVAVPAALSAATFLAATPWLRAYAVRGAAPLFIVASVASVLIASLGTRMWRLPAAVSYAVSAAALVMLLLAAAGLHPDAIGRSLVHGPNELLTETLPLSGTGASLAAPLVLTWLCGAGTTELVTRRPRWQPGLPGIGLAIPLATYVLAYAVTSSRPGRTDVVAPLLFMTLIAVTLVRHAARLSLTRQAGVGPAVEDGARSPLWRGALAGGVTAALVVSGLAAAIPSLPAMSRIAASLNRPAPLAMASLIDPVDATAALRDSRPDASAQPLLRVRTDESSSGYLAAAILDDYDGARWSFASTFRPTGGRIPPASGSGGAGTLIDAGMVRQDETLLTALPTPMLPALDRPLSIAGVSAVADSSTGMILPGQALKPGVSFEVTSRTPGSTVLAVPRADGVGVPAGQTAGRAGAPDLAVPADSSAAMTTALRFLSDLTGERPAASVAFLQAAMSALHTDERRVDPTLAPRSTPASPRAPTRAGRTTPTATATPPNDVTSGGTSLSEVIDAVTFNQSATPEQFATFFAMVARDLGVPARVVTGFRLVDSSSAGSVAPGTYQVTNRMAWTWVEIPVAGRGWVVADPTPDTPTAESAPPPVPVRATPTTIAPPQANAVPQSEITGAHAIARPVPIKVPRSQHLPGWVLALLVGAAIVVAVLLAGPGLAGLRRQIRRRRRHRTDPSELAIGAWLELLDGLHQAGLSPPRGATSAEVAVDAGRAFGAGVSAPVRQVGELADRAVFSVSHPPERADAEHAWRQQRRLRRAVLRSLDRRQRTRALLSVGAAPRDPCRREP
jgi:hypothetical protein